MLNVQHITVPFVSAFDISSYLESLGLAVSLTGDYIETRLAADNFVAFGATPVPTGYVRLVSGSGYWLASGATNNATRYVWDILTGYTTGYYQYNALTGSFKNEGYGNLPPGLTGFIRSSENFFWDFFTGSQTGYYYDNSLTGNFAKSEYNTMFKSRTGCLQNYVYYQNNSGSLTSKWTVTNRYALSSSGPFAGSSGYISNLGTFLTYPYNSAFALGDYTLELWLNRFRNDSVSDTLIETNQSAGFGLVLEPQSSNRLYCYNNGGLLISSGSVPINNWCHIAVTRSTGNLSNPSGLAIYFTGILVANNPTWTAAQATGRLTSTDGLIVGATNANPSTLITSGYVAEVRLFNYCKSQAQIQADYNQKISPSSTGLLLYFSI